MVKLLDEISFFQEQSQKQSQKQSIDKQMDQFEKSVSEQFSFEKVGWCLISSIGDEEKVTLIKSTDNKPANFEQWISLYQSGKSSLKKLCEDFFEIGITSPLGYLQEIYFNQNKLGLIFFERSSPLSFDFEEYVQKSSFLKMQVIPILLKLSNDELLLRNFDTIILNYKIQSLSTLAAGISHEINNPLTILHGSWNLIQNILTEHKFVNNEVDKLFQAGVNAILRIQDIIIGIKELGRNNSKEMKTSKIELNSMLQNLIQLSEGVYQKSGIKILFNKPSYALFVQGDKGRLLQLFMNLLSNAHDAICEKQEKLKIPYEGLIEINSWIEQDSKSVAGDLSQRIVLEIKDNGIGISKEKMVKIFDPFFTTKAPNRGAGLGLSLSRSIVRSLQGTINVESGGGEGEEMTLFRITFPTQSNQSLETSSKNLVVNSSSNYPKLEKILIVDDEDDIRKMVVNYLKYAKINCECDEAGSVNEAFLKIKSNSYSVIITDQKMPHMGGDLLILENHHQKLNLKFILMSGAIQDEYLIAQNPSLAPYILGFLKKPFTKQDLSSLLKLHFTLL